MAWKVVDSFVELPEQELAAPEYSGFTVVEWGGIHDHIGGSFSRYSTDEKWLVPHFERMVYDNALLLMAYVTVYQHTKEEHFADVARPTADYILRELTDAQDGLPDELLQYLKENPADGIQVLLKTESNAEALAQCAPFTRDYPVPETGAMYYLCENGACKAPVKSLTELGL